MAKSMTGFGRATTACDYGDITVEIRTVNSRFFEFNLRDSHFVLPIESEIRRVVSEAIERGKIDLRVNLRSANDRSLTRISLNQALADTAKEATLQLRNALGNEVSDDAQFNAIAGLPGMFIQTHQELSGEEMLSLVMPVLHEAISYQQTMALTEGNRLVEDLLGKLDEMIARIAEVEAVASELPQLYAAKLNKRLAEFICDESQPWLEQRLATEVTLFADRAAIDEELVRLDSHISQMKKLLRQSDRIGKQAEFLLQELNREINTIGSKANELQITNHVVACKNILECIREQVQNLV